MSVDLKSITSPFARLLEGPPAADENPVTADELEWKAAEVVKSVRQEAERKGLSVSRDAYVSAMLAAVPGGRIEASHPAAKALVRLLVSRFTYATQTAVEEHINAVAVALSRWSRGDWRSLVRPAVRDEFLNQFADRYEQGGGDLGMPPAISGLLLYRQPCIVGGRSKSMKTTLAADKAAALITGTPFLGLEVEFKTPVLYLTRERTAASVRAMVDKSAARRGNGEPARLLVTSDARLLLTDDGRARLRGYVDEGGAYVVIIDPLYLFNGEANITDMGSMGERLRWLAEPITSAGGTPVFIHHTNKNSPVGEWPKLDDLSGAGVAEYARSWLLVSRAKEYDGGKVHDLLAVAGTCEGDHARLHVSLNEDTMATSTGNTLKAKAAVLSAPVKGVKR